MVGMQGERPEWAERLRREREARGWSQTDAVRAMRTYSEAPLPAGLADQWKRWERGRNRPDEFYRPLIAAALGTVVESIFPSKRPEVPRGSADELLIARSGMDTRELVGRMRGSSIDDSTLDALAATVEQLCCDYVDRDPHELIRESREWLGRATQLLDQRVTFTQHRDILDSAGWLTLLIGCLEFDTGRKSDAEATRVAALELGSESGNSPVSGWAHEMSAWFAITGARYSDVIEAAQAGQDAAPGRSVAVQLYAQEAKAWARIGDQRNVHKALEKGRELLDSLPYPERPDNHFVVDPDKFDYYSMDCYRLIGNDTLAEMHAHETIRKSTAPDGSPLSPMRLAESALTLGVVAARRGDVEDAIAYGESALSQSRQSAPSLLMVGAELASALESRFPRDSRAADFRQSLLRATSGSPAC